MVRACADRDRQGVIDRSTTLGFLTGAHTERKIYGVLYFTNFSVYLNQRLPLYSVSITGPQGFTYVRLGLMRI